MPAVKPADAPLSMIRRAERAEIVPSRSAASFRSTSAAGPARPSRKTSRRVRFSHTGRPTARESRQAIGSSRQTLAPKAPPTGIGTTRTSLGDTPRASAVSWRVAKIPWVGVQTVKRSPSSAQASVE